MTYVDTVKGWLGTPYKHSQKTKGQGCDCFGLVRGTVEEYRGVLTEQPIKYSPSWLDVGTVDELKEYLDRNLTPIKVREVGSIILFNVLGVNRHLGVMTTPTKFIHSVEPHGVIELPLTTRWESRITHLYKV